MGFPIQESEQLTARKRRDLKIRIREALKDEIIFGQTADEFYQSLGISIDTVHRLIRSILYYPRFFPRREPRDV